MPATGVVPRQSLTEPVSTVAESSGSLKTMTTMELSGTSRLWGGGLVRTTMGRVVVATTDRNEVGPAPPIARTVITRVSPSLAGSATGSKPPFTTGR